MKNWVQLTHLVVPVSLSGQDKKCSLYETYTSFNNNYYAGIYLWKW